MSVASIVDKGAAPGTAVAVALALAVPGIRRYLGNVKPANHTLALVALFKVGMTKPGDGQFARNANKAHKKISLTGSDLTSVWRAQIVFAGMAGGSPDDNYMSAARIYGGFLNVPEGDMNREFGYHKAKILSAARSINQLPGGSKDMLWAAISNRQVYSALGGATDDKVLALLSKLISPHFAALYRR